MDPVGNASGKQGSMQSEALIGGHKIDGMPKEGNEFKTEKEPVSPSSSSDTYSDEDFIQLEASGLNESTTGVHQPGENTKLALEESTTGVHQPGENAQLALKESTTGVHQPGENAQLALKESTTTVHQPGENTQLKPEDSPQSNGATVGGSTIEHQTHNLSNDGSSLAGSLHPDQVPIEVLSSADLSGVRRSPPIQVMGKSDVPDPNRIPSSVFQRTTTTTTPMEWSVASNESLFSIHMGNSSFSKDHAFLLGRSQELGNYPGSPWDGPSPSPPPPSAPVMQLSAPLTPTPSTGCELVQPATAKATTALEKPGATEKTNAEATNDVLSEAAEGRDKDRLPAEVGPRSTSTTSRTSDGSVTSFAFPILTGEAREGSIKVVSENQPVQMEQQQQQQQQHQQQQPQQQQQQHTPAETPKAAPDATESKWFSCLLCCSFCR